MLDLNAGDCIEGLKALKTDSVQLILTDIPYDEVNRKSNGLRNLDKKDADVLNFDLPTFIDECIRVCAGSIYIFCGIGQVSQIRNHFVARGMTNRQCGWEKTNPSPMNGQRMWLSSFENCIFAKKQNATFNEHCKSAVWRFSCGRGKVHPTEKPLPLFEHLIKSSSNEGDIVCDPCFGSGTAAVAAKKLKRRFIGFEINPDYVAVAQKRIDETV